MLAHWTTANVSVTTTDLQRSTAQRGHAVPDGAGVLG